MVLFDTDNRIFGPSLATMHRVLSNVTKEGGMCRQPKMPLCK
jgi:hypothetical protein